MPQPRPDASPFGVRRPVGKLNQIQCLLHPFSDFGQRCALSRVGVKTPGQYGKGFRTDVLTKQKVLVVPDAERLVIAPVIAPRRTLFQRTHGFFPAVHGIPGVFVQASRMGQAAAGEPQKFRLHLAQCPGNICAHPVFAPQKRIAGKQGNHVQFAAAALQKPQYQPPRRGGLQRLQRKFIFFPDIVLQKKPPRRAYLSLRTRTHRCPANALPCVVQYTVLTRFLHGDLQPCRCFLQAFCPKRKEILFPLFQIHPAPITAVGDKTSLFCLHVQIVRILRMKRIVGANFPFHPASLLPGGQGMILFMIRLTILKRAVLYQFRIQTAVRCVVQILKKQPEQILQFLVCFFFQNRNFFHAFSFKTQPDSSFLPVKMPVYASVGFPFK